jgi:Icc protein
MVSPRARWPPPCTRSSSSGRPQAVVVSGDLANSAATGEYERLRELLEPLPMPVHVLAGNHDDRDALREHFGPAQARGPGERLR